MKIKITKNNEVLKYDVVLRRENINVGVVKDKENDKCIKKIIYTVVNDQGIDLIHASAPFYLSPDDNKCYIERHANIGGLLELLDYPIEINKYHLMRIKRLILSERAHVVDKLYEKHRNSKNEDLTNELFKVKYYNLVTRGIKKR